jgi:hypothetical protein
MGGSMREIGEKRALRLTKEDVITMHNMLVQKAKELEADNRVLLKIQNKIKIAQIETRLIELETEQEPLDALRLELKRIKEN